MHFLRLPFNFPVSVVFQSQTAFIESAAADRPFARKTSLHYAVIHEKAAITKLLLSNGANVNAKDNNGQTPLSLVVKNGYAEIIELLRKHRAKE